MENKKKALVIVIPGTFGDHNSNLGNVLAEISGNNDMDSIIVPNPFSEEFQFSYSTYGLVGLPQTDLINLKTLLSDVINFYTKEYGSPNKITVVGLSLGGLFSALLSKSDLQNKIHRFVSINPPVDLKYSLSIIDNIIQTRDTNNLGNFFQTMDGLIDSLLMTKKGINVGNIASVKAQIPLSENTNSIIIGRTFSRGLKNIFRNLRNMDIMPSTRPLLAEINDLDRRRKKSFVKYAELLYEVQKITGLIGDRSLEDLYSDVNFKTILRANPRAGDVFVITNNDDFIIHNSHLKSLAPNMGSRLNVFKAGGHCGNYWSPSFGAALSRVLNQ